MTPEEIIREHCRRIGSKGGKVSSPRKIKAARRNAKKPRPRIKNTTEPKPKH